MVSKAALVACVAVGVVSGSTACTSGKEQDRAAGSQAAGESRAGDAGRASGQPHGTDQEQGTHHGHGSGKEHGHRSRIVVGPTCNVLETVSPEDSTYRPRVARAPRQDRARARSLLADVNEFCTSTSPSELMAEWVPGTTTPTKPTHYFNPDRRGSLGLDPANPRAVLVYRQRIGGVMFTGVPLPSLGSIPRPHTHDPTGGREMLHVYCTSNLADAFTPDRELGVLADTIVLRQKVRPLVADLHEPWLTAALRVAREHVGDELPRVDPRTIAPGLGDAALRAKREELRQALMLVSEAQLRRLLAMVRPS